MLMHAARTLDEALTRKWEAMEAEGAGEDGGLEAEKGIQIILLDGEEAFVAWTAQDSLYGARSLAAEWENTFHPAMSTFHNQLSSISLFVLLDLLGASNPTVPSWFKTTHWAYRAMAKLETRLRSLGNFKSSPNHESKRQQKRDEEEALFLPEASKSDGRFLSHAIQDDHIPFMARGVEVLHLIPSPFPDAWHNKKGIPDDGEHLDMDTVEDWATLVTAFAAEWMDLEGHFDAARPRGAMGKMRRDESKSEL
ncbi:hypothetical protein BDY21DRAFT_346184 [Lineolata rhizophorae]|uniref:Peptide hydrolase n=1 Tax=Lineolata rhizophorae TaxID=578093 RepID=A0A6A6NYI2_9PEZI|nr:hypothetical protein BDY21DRAFT_346184 [Lineolata rhizophorae]